jgi:DNA-binding NarL/FixJ family response regulator
LILSEDTDELGDRTSANTSIEVLTRRELQIALMIAEGHGNKQIAYQLRLSEWTVSSYLRRIYTKLGVHNRAAMVARLLADVTAHPAR